MGLFDRLRRKSKYFRYDLCVNEGDGWKKFGEYGEYVPYDEIDDPTPGAVLRLYGVYEDKSSKEGFRRRALWTEKVPSPGGESKEGTKKEKPIDEKLMEKLVESADFSGLRPSKMSIPFGKTGGSLEFESPALSPGGDSKGFVKIDGNIYPMGDMPPLEFEGKLPAWLHPAAGAMITGLIDRFGGMVKSSLSSAISDATGIRAKNSSSKVIAEKSEVLEETKEPQQPPNMVAEIDELLESSSASYNGVPPSKKKEEDTIESKKKQDGVKTKTKKKVN